MTRSEIAKLLMLATSNFPHLQDKDMQPTAVLWEKSLQDLPYELAEKAMIKVLATTNYFPTISHIRDAAVLITSGRKMDAIEAWELVVKAIRRYGYINEKEALESLPDDVANMVRRFTWLEICRSTNVDTLRAQFRMAWETEAKRHHELSLLPEYIRQAIKLTTSQMKSLPDKQMQLEGGTTNE